LDTRFFKTSLQYSKFVFFNTFRNNLEFLEFIAGRKISENSYNTPQRSLSPDFSRNTFVEKVSWKKNKRGTVTDLKGPFDSTKQRSINIMPNDSYKTVEVRIFDSTSKVENLVTKLEYVDACARFTKKTKYVRHLTRPDYFIDFVVNENPSKYPFLTKELQKFTITPSKKSKKKESHD
jgi:hypothetical protein